jgi:hypothetical protein
MRMWYPLYNFQRVICKQLKESMNRRYFRVRRQLLPRGSSAPPSPNDTVRVAVVGCGGRGNSHGCVDIHSERGARCAADVDDAEDAIGTLQRRGSTGADLRAMFAGAR